MRREIYEQPQAITKTVEKHLRNDIIFPGELQAIESALLTFEKLIIAASGSSRHAGLAGEIMIEDLSGVAVDVEYASEYCYRSTHAAVDPIVMVITQSGGANARCKDDCSFQCSRGDNCSRGRSGIDHRGRP